MLIACSPVKFEWTAFHSGLLFKKQIFLFELIAFFFISIRKIPHLSRYFKYSLPFYSKRSSVRQTKNTIRKSRVVSISNKSNPYQKKKGFNVLITRNAIWHIRKYVPNNDLFNALRLKKLIKAGCDIKRFLASV